METIEKISDDEVKVTTSQETVFVREDLEAQKETFTAEVMKQKNIRTTTVTLQERQLAAIDAKITDAQAKLDKVTSYIESLNGL